MVGTPFSISVGKEILLARRKYIVPIFPPTALLRTVQLIDLANFTNASTPSSQLSPAARTSGLSGSRSEWWREIAVLNGQLRRSQSAGSTTPVEFWTGLDLQRWA